MSMMTLTMGHCNKHHFMKYLQEAQLQLHRGAEPALERLSDQRGAR
jgi:hypothetical protein